jgi:hypothetical protein
MQDAKANLVKKMRERREEETRTKQNKTKQNQTQNPKPSLDPSQTHPNPSSRNPVVYNSQSKPIPSYHDLDQKKTNRQTKTPRPRKKPLRQPSVPLHQLRTMHLLALFSLIPRVVADGRERRIRRQGPALSVSSLATHLLQTQRRTPPGRSQLTDTH